MIPKKIHYIWFGGKPLPELTIRCIESWKSYCPDYEIIQWNESNFNFHENAYAEEAYKEKKWAFVSDYARLHILVNEGGIYIDTDVELLKSLDSLLVLEAFSGFEVKNRIQTALMGCQAGHPFFKELLESYKQRHFIKNDGSMDLTTNVSEITSHCLKKGLQLNNKLQEIDGITIFPNDFFCPKNVDTLQIKITQNSYAIHHFDGSWLTKEQQYAKEINSRLKLGKIFSPKMSVHISNFIAAWHFRGLKIALKETINWIKRLSIKRGL